MRENQKFKSITHMVVVVLVVITMLLLSSPVYATHYDPSYLMQPMFQKSTPTPEGTPTAVTEQTIQEGRPIGIVIGAAGLVILIFLSATLFLPKRDPKSN